jgi:Flp pilus assembly protein TadD
MWRNAGELDQAAAVLEEAIDRWPEDMTFHEDRAKLALRTGDLDTATREAALAVEHGLGDNRLRALATYAKALHAAGRTDEAVAAVQDALDHTTEPTAGVQVRTPGYLDALRALPFMAADGPAVPTP